MSYQFYIYAILCLPRKFNEKEAADIKPTVDRVECHGRDMVRCMRTGGERNPFGTEETKNESKGI